MKTYDVLRANGGVHGFEIDSPYITVNQSASVLKRIAGVSDVRVRKAFSEFEDVHIRFTFRNVECVIWEPFGDNSRYWIGPEKPEIQVDVSALREGFERYQPSKLRRVFGDLITLDFKSLLGLK